MTSESSCHAPSIGQSAVKIGKNYDSVHPATPKICTKTGMGLNTLVISESRERDDYGQVRQCLQGAGLVVNCPLNLCAVYVHTLLVRRLTIVEPSRTLNNVVDAVVKSCSQ